MADGSGVVWFGASGLEVLGHHDDGVEVTIEVQTTATVVGCDGRADRAPQPRAMPRSSMRHMSSRRSGSSLQVCATLTTLLRKTDPACP